MQACPFPCQTVLMDPNMDDDGEGTQQRAGEVRRRARTPLQTMKEKGGRGRESREARERESLDLLEDIERSKANTEQR